MSILSGLGTLLGGKFANSFIWPAVGYLENRQQVDTANRQNEALWQQALNYLGGVGPAQGQFFSQAGNALLGGPQAATFTTPMSGGVPGQMQPPGAASPSAGWEQLGNYQDWSWLAPHEKQYIAGNLNPGGRYYGISQGDLNRQLAMQYKTDAGDMTRFQQYAPELYSQLTSAQPSTAAPPAAGAQMPGMAAPSVAGQTQPDWLGGYAGRFAAAMEELNKLSDQASMDINRGAAEERARQMQQLGQSGLAGTSVAQSAASGVERERMAAQNRLADLLARERIGTGGQFSGDYLAQAANLMSGRLGLEQDLTGQNLATLLSMQYQSPTPLNLSDALQSGMNTRLAYNQLENRPKWYEGGVLPGLISAGGNVGAGYAYGAALNCDAALKCNVREISDDATLEHLDHLPVKMWSYRNEHSDIDHIGPMAQDFYSAFQLGGDTRKIETVDAIGVLMSAVKALSAKVKALESELNGKTDRKPIGARPRKSYADVKE